MATNTLTEILIPRLMTGLRTDYFKKAKSKTKEQQINSSL